MYKWTRHWKINVPLVAGGIFFYAQTIANAAWNVKKNEKNNLFFRLGYSRYDMVSPNNFLNNFGKGKFGKWNSESKI